MYQCQAGQSEFLLPFGGTLDPANRWVRLAQVVPWAVAESAYVGSLKGPRGQRALPARMALGTLIIQTRCGWTDRETVEQIRENPYLQYFLGFREFVQGVPFDASMLVHFRSRFGMELIGQINEALIAAHRDPAVPTTSATEQPCTAVASDDDDDSDDAGGSAPSAQPRVEPPSAAAGTLIIDATCTPADITYPTDLKLVNHAREITEQVIDLLHAPLCGSEPKPRTYRRTARKLFLTAAKSKRLSRSGWRTAIGKQLRFLRRNFATISHLLTRPGVTLRLLPPALYGKLLVAAEIDRQQTLMYRERSHRVDERIVNLAQPHVRPIVRGKAGTPVEFGAKISASTAHGFATLDCLSWSAFNKSGDLSLQAERYRTRHGHYPATIHADAIYRTRANRRWCTDHGIRLAGPPLGRPPIDSSKAAALARQIRADECARVPIEGVFGVLKRRYGLDRVMAKLAHTSESVIAIAFLVLNLAKILWLCLDVAAISIIQRWLAGILILINRLLLVDTRCSQKMGTA
jgi:transposase, IS5 family